MAKLTRNTHGEVSSEARRLVAALTAATRAKPGGVVWCIGCRRDDERGDTLVVASNIGLAWLPARVGFQIDRVHHVHADGQSIPWGMRRWWVGDPIRAITEFGRHTPGNPISVLVGMAEVFAGHDLLGGVDREIVTPEMLPDVTIGPIGAQDRLRMIDPALKDDLFGRRDSQRSAAAPTATALVTRLPEGGSSAVFAKPDPQRSEQLWNAVVYASIAQAGAPSAGGQRVPPDQHIDAWQAFCEDQLAVSAYRLRTAKSDDRAARHYADYVYWRWNLDQLHQDASV